jgi:DNA-binding YbaB/EbfC family protein
MSDGDPQGPSLRNLIETAQRIQAEMGRVRDSLSGKTVEGETGGGLVRCVANGRGELLSITIDPSIFGGDKKMVEDLVVGAVNLALDRAKQLAQEELAQATGGLPLPPGLFGG